MKKNEDKSVFEKLAEVNSDAEIWWDSSAGEPGSIRQIWGGWCKSSYGFYRVFRG